MRPPLPPGMNPMPPLCRYVRLCERRGGLILLGLAAVGLCGLLLALRLELRTDLADLLPPEHPAVVALRRVTARQRSASSLVLLVGGPDPAQCARFAAALRPHLAALTPHVFSEIVWRPETEVADFAWRWRWLYADRADLLRAEDLLDRLVARRRSPLLVDLEGDPEAELEALRREAEGRLPQRGSPEGPQAFAGPDPRGSGLHYLGVLLWRRGGAVAGVDDRAALAALQRAVAAAAPQTYGPLRVEYTGPIAMAIEEHDALLGDLALVSGVCLGLVLLALGLHLRRPAAVLAVGAPAALAVLLALGLAALLLGHLNASTAFLTSIILGNGINAPIILLGRYGEERRRGLEVAPALAAALAAAARATGAAMAAAAVAYGCLLLTSLRGFSQFGLIGGAGMLLAWAAALLLTPPLVLLGERRWPGALTPGPSLLVPPFRWLGRAAGRAPRTLALIALGLAAAALVPAARYARAPLEYNFNNLRSTDPATQRRWEIMYALGLGNVGAGQVGSDAVLLVDEPAQADPVARALLAQDRARGADGVLREVRTLGSLLPDHQEEKLAILGRLRAKIDRHLGVMDEEERRAARAWRPPDDLRPLGVEDLPRRVREAFTEVDGTRGRLIGIDADATRFQDWNGRDLLRLSRSLRVEALGKTWVAASHATLFAAMLEVILRDGPRLGLAALAGVAVVLALLLGPTGARAVLAVVGVGLLWLAGLLGLLDLKLNFLNFVAVPITLGVGADYGANLWARLRGGRGAGELGEAGAAVALCSLTTIIGYGALLLAHNRALRTFGLLAGLGEVTCLGAALLLIPALAAPGACAPAR